MKKKISRTEAAKKTKKSILSAAIELFTQQGYKRVSIEKIADFAGIAKGTIYIYYKSKSVLFEAVCGCTAQSFLAEVESCFNADWPSHQEHIQSILNAKLIYYHRLLHQSPYAKDLEDASERLGAKVFEQAHRQWLDFVAQGTKQAEQSGALDLNKYDITAKEFAHLLYIATKGAEQDLPEESYKQQLNTITSAILRGYSCAQNGNF